LNFQSNTCFGPNFTKEQGKVFKQEIAILKDNLNLMKEGIQSERQKVQ
jgi:hypothetical protein